MTLDAAESLQEKIRSRSAVIAVVGLGYVGLPMAVELAKVGFKVHGIDLSDEKVAKVNRGESYLRDIPSLTLAWLVQAGRLRASSDPDPLAEADAIFICVPTPFTANKAPDISYIVRASESISRLLRRGQLVVLQSTTHPGTTEEDVLPILRRSGLAVGHDFFLAFSPERINPGDRENTVANTPKVVGGVTPACGAVARQLLRTITPQVHVVSSPRTAETCKLLENIFRSVNIALVNELALLCERMKVDIWEVIAADSTKPFGYLPFYPGPGVGGHCIPVDPYYLSWKAREFDFYTKFIELAAEVNQDMPYHVVRLVAAALNRRGKALSDSDVLVLGVAFKRDVDDARNSPAERIIELLLEAGARVSYNDPFIPVFSVGDRALHPQRIQLESVPLSDHVLARADCVAIVTGHSQYDYQAILDRADMVLDCCNATRGSVARGNLLKLGATDGPVGGP